MPSKKTLDEALHVRLLIDNPDRLRFMDWVNGNWRQAALGVFYLDGDVLDNAIFEITQAVLEVEGQLFPQLLPINSGTTSIETLSQRTQSKQCLRPLRMLFLSRQLRVTSRRVV